MYCTKSWSSLTHHKIFHCRQQGQRTWRTSSKSWKTRSNHANTRINLPNIWDTFPYRPWWREPTWKHPRVHRQDTTRKCTINWACLLTGKLRFASVHFWVHSWNLRTCRTSVNKPSTGCVRSACPELSTSLEQLGTSLTRISDSLQGCPNNSDTDLL